MALKHLNLDYEIQILADPSSAPKGKLPYIEINGEITADSEIIFDKLDELTQGALFKQLTPTENATGMAFTRLIEDHLYWMMVASRWLDDDWWPNIKEGFFAEMPLLVRSLVGPMARRQMRQTYNLQGLGRHTLEEQKAFARRDLEAIKNATGDTGYLIGNRLTVYDFTAAAMISGILDNKPATWLTDIARGIPSLVGYAEKIQSEIGVFGRVL
jgi:glutathione S-transferase